jgi:hypothetical protein
MGIYGTIWGFGHSVNMLILDLFGNDYEYFCVSTLSLKSIFSFNSIQFKS